jgi:ribose 1,5-bisphosphokinase
MRLIYTIGPSGAGKDSVLNWIRLHVPQDNVVRFAQRVIDRAVQPLGEQHEPIEAADFETQRAHNAFAMHWHANGHSYGIRHEQFKSLAPTQWIFVNGSRSYLDTALALFPNMVVLHITAPQPVLAHRLAARNRESAEEIALRLSRAAPFAAPVHCAFIEVHNDRTLEAAGLQVLQALRNL